MKKPYFLEKDLPNYVREYMDNHKFVDVETLTDHLIETVHIYRKKKLKVFQKCVESAYLWNKYLMDLESGKNTQSSTNKDKEIQVLQKTDTPEKSIPKNTKSTKTPSGMTSKSKENSAIEGAVEENIKSSQRPKLGRPLIELKDMKGMDSLIQPVYTLLSEFSRICRMSVLLSGPEGCGKSTLLDAMASMLGLPIAVLDCRALCGEDHLSSPAKRTQKELNRLVDSLPAILHLDNMNILFERETGSGSSSNKKEEITACISTWVEGMMENVELLASHKRILLVGECTFPELMDARLRRLFVRPVAMQPPNKEGRVHILQSLLGTRLRPEHDLEAVALRASSFVAMDLKCLVNIATSRATTRAVAANIDFSPGPAMNPLGPFQESQWDYRILQEDLLEAAKSITPSLKKSGFPAIPDTTWADIGGLTLHRDTLTDLIIEPILEPEAAGMFGAPRSSGILLWGPPGCGKTLLAKAVANEAGINLLIVNGPSLLNMYQGESERAVREVFARAGSVAPCIIFFDEFDSLCPRRSGTESGSKATIVNTLLTEMDGFLSRPGIYMLAATNLPNILDPAVLRPGRFETRLFVGLPDQEARLAVFRAATKNGTAPSLASDVSLAWLASVSNSFTGADCRHLVERGIVAARRELRARGLGGRKRKAGDEFTTEKKLKLSNGAPAPNGAPVPNAPAEAEQNPRYPDGLFAVYRRHFDSALSQVHPSVSQEELKKYEELRRKFENE